MIKEYPPIWIRAFAVNMSHNHPDYLLARMWNKEPALGIIKDKIDVKEGDCFDDCRGVEFEEHFKYKYMLILEGETAPWARPCW